MAAGQEDIRNNCTYCTLCLYLRLRFADALKT